MYVYIESTDVNKNSDFIHLPYGHNVNYNVKFIFCDASPCFIKKFVSVLCILLFA